MAMIPASLRLKTYRGDYDFSVDGGAISTITLRSKTGPIPIGSIILGGYADVTTLVAAGGSAGTVAIQAESAGDMIAAASVLGAPWSSTGVKSTIPVFTGATAVKTTAERAPAMVIGAFALTAGVFGIVLLYV
jgi:hypothetical protein